MFRETAAVAAVINGVEKIADFGHKYFKGFVKWAALTPTQFSEMYQTHFPSGYYSLALVNQKSTCCQVL